ncbi:MAG TPA: hypothetical protein PKA64_06395 [Myxococcota bacterium]|nr:hypothetical protein [Myxococcota bacterium]
MSDAEATGAHYLHEHTGLTLLVKTTVRDASALAWTRSGDLIVGTSTGSAFSVHPTFGTRVLWTDRPSVLGVGTFEDCVLLVEAGGAWARLDGDGQIVARGDHRFVGPVQVTQAGDTILLQGATAEDHRVEVLQSDRRVFRVILPPRALALSDGHTLRLARSTVDGLEVISTDPGSRFSDARAERRSLQRSGDRVLGIGRDDVKLWTDSGAWLATLHLPSVRSCELASQGRVIFLGTSDGGLGMVDRVFQGNDPRPSTIHIDDVPIAAVAVSPAQRIVASAASAVSLWTWDESPPRAA